LSNEKKKKKKSRVESFSNKLGWALQKKKGGRAGGGRNTVEGEKGGGLENTLSVTKLKKKKNYEKGRVSWE